MEAVSAPPLDDVEKLVKESDLNLEFVLLGNNLCLRQIALRWLTETNDLARVQISTDEGAVDVSTKGLLRHVVEVSSLCEIPAPVAIALASGNPARIWGLNAGRLQVGRDADLVIVDRPIGSSAADGLESMEIGDMPSVGMVVIDGVIVQLGSNTTLKVTAKLKSFNVILHQVHHTWNW